MEKGAQGSQSNAEEEEFDVLNTVEQEEHKSQEPQLDEDGFDIL